MLSTGPRSWRITSFCERLAVELPVDGNNPVANPHPSDIGGTARDDLADPERIGVVLENRPDSTKAVARRALIASRLWRRIPGKTVKAAGDAVEHRLVDLVLRMGG